jgi:uncharacterized protein
MLIRFRVSNFRSLRDEQELSMVAALKDGRKDLVHVDSMGVDLLRVAGIYGANAAGKSNVLDALRFMRSAVLQSYRTWEPDGPIPREPFRLDSIHQEEGSLFEVDFLLEGERYQYGFELDSTRILREWLHGFPNKRRQVLFTRDAEAATTFHFGKQLKGNHRAIEKVTRKNSLFLSTAAQNAHETLQKIYSWFGGVLIGDVGSREYWTLETARLLEKKHREILDLLRLADLGIVDVRIADPVRRDRRGRRLSSGWAEEANRVLEFKHQSKSGPFALALGDQSRGTQAWFSLVGAVLVALDTGGLLCLDEIDASLHPLLTIQLIRLFQDARRNPRSAQLIFNTHDTLLLGSLLAEPALRRDQIWFVEKDQEGASSLYPLTDFKPRKLENVERGYIQGRYGAIPFIDPSEAA